MKVRISIVSGFAFDDMMVMEQDGNDQLILGQYVETEVHIDLQSRRSVREITVTQTYVIGTIGFRGWTRALLEIK